MKKWFSFLSNRKETPKESQGELSFSDGRAAYQEAKKLFYTNDQKERNDEQALLLFDKAIESGITDAYADRAFCLQGLKYHYDAISDFDSAINNCPNDANLFYGRGHSKKIIGNYDCAIIDLNEAVELSSIESDLNKAYNDEMQIQGGSSVTQFYEFQLQDIMDRKESSQEKNLKELYERRIKEIKRRNISSK